MSHSDTSSSDGELATKAFPENSSPFEPVPERPWFQRAVPVVRQLREYRASTAGRELLAGVTVAALAAPSAMAYAELAGLSPVNGLYALLHPTVAYALLGSSRQLVVGPEGSISALVAVSVLSFAAAGSADAAELAASSRWWSAPATCSRSRWPRLAGRLFLSPCVGWVQAWCRRGADQWVLRYWAPAAAFSSAP